MALGDVARWVRDSVLATERLRRANPGARITRVQFGGDVSRCHLAEQVSVIGPTVIWVGDGGGLTGGRLTVGERTYIGEFNNIRTAGAPITIGRDCLISQHITIVGSNHGTAPGRTIVSQDWSGDGVVIGDDVWVGAGATILPGARIGDGAIIAANSVVRGEVPPGTIYGGSPARQIGVRS